MRRFVFGGLIALVLLAPVASAQDPKPGADAPKLTPGNVVCTVPVVLGTPSSGANLGSNVSN